MKLLFQLAQVEMHYVHCLSFLSSRVEDEKTHWQIMLQLQSLQGITGFFVKMFYEEITKIFLREMRG